MEKWCEKMARNVAYLWMRVVCLWHLLAYLLLSVACLYLRLVVLRLSALDLACVENGIPRAAVMPKNNRAIARCRVSGFAAVRDVRAFSGIALMTSYTGNSSASYINVPYRFEANGNVPIDSIIA